MNSSIERSIMISMMQQGFIREENPIVWHSPFNEYQFVFERHQNQMIRDIEGEAEYLIEMNIVNMIGVKIASIRFTEIDAFLLIDFLDSYFADKGMDGYSFMFPETPEGYIQELVLSTIPDDQIDKRKEDNNQWYDSVNDQYRNIMMQFTQYSQYYGTIIELAHVILSESELKDSKSSNDFEFIIQFSVLDLL